MGQCNFANGDERQSMESVHHDTTLAQYILMRILLRERGEHIEAKLCTVVGLQLFLDIFIMTNRWGVGHNFQISPRIRYDSVVYLTCSKKLTGSQL